MQKENSSTQGEKETETRIQSRPTGFRMFADAQLDDIHLSSLEILRRTGVRVHEAESLDLLRQAGCSVTDENLVRFPAAVIENAIDAAPSRIVLCNRTGEPRVILESNRSFFGTGSDLPNTIDLESGERRPSLLADVKNAALLADSLPNLDFVMSMALPSDLDMKTSDRHSFLAMTENTVKPLVFTAWDEAGLADIIAMSETIVGGPDNLQLSPFLLAYLEPTSPLQHTEVVLRKVLMMADHGLPFVYAPGPVDGGTSPVTPAGSLALANAEVISGNAIAQLRRKGTPVVWGSGSGPLDMKTMVATYSSPEFMLHCMAMAELAHYYYKKPVWGFAGCSDSKLPDIQAGIESALWIYSMALSGSNLIHDAGYIESGMTASLEMMVVADEIISFVRRLIGGIEFTPETLALDVINKVGPGGSFMNTMHTRQNFRKVWYPRVLDRHNHHGWIQAGQPTAIKTARDLAKDAILNHKPTPIAPGISETLNSIIAEADKRAGLI
jgi:trimethylamine--corrinoid protein Co-methyltransferase